MNGNPDRQQRLYNAYGNYMRNTAAANGVSAYEAIVNQRNLSATRSQRMGLSNG